MTGPFSRPFAPGAGKVLAVVLWLIWPAMAVAGEALTSQAAELAGQLDALSARTGLTDTERAKAFIAIMEPGFDLDHLAAEALGPQYRDDAAHWPQYRLDYRAHMIHAHFHALRFGATQTQVLGIRPMADGSAAIQLRVTTPTRVQMVVWFTCPGGGFRVCDAETDGQRLSVRQRENFTAALGRLGWERFLQALRRGALVEF